jgi:RNA polymerase sigma-70 factor, ECF subfamily
MASSQNTPAALSRASDDPESEVFDPIQLATSGSHSDGERIDADHEFRNQLLSLIPFVRACSHSICRDREQAEDFAQDTLCKAWASRSTFQRGSNFKAWLFTILRNEHYSYRRWAWRKQPWDEDAAQDMLVTEGNQIWAAELSDVACGLTTISAAQREALILVGLAGYSYGEVAARLQCSEGTVKSRAARGRDALSAFLNGSRASTGRPSPPTGRPTFEGVMTDLASLTREWPGDALPRKSASTRQTRDSGLAVVTS